MTDRLFMGTSDRLFEICLTVCLRRGFIDKTGGIGIQFFYSEEE